MKVVKDHLKALQIVLPVPFPVVLKFGIPEHEQIRGDAKVLQDAEGNATGVIRIETGMRPTEALEVLCHEYAHLLTWGYSGFAEDTLWGVHYADCYRIVFGKH